MGRDLTNLNIKDTYEGLVQISGSQITDGTGSLIPSLEITASLATTASYAETATSSSHAVSSDTSISASHAVFADTAGAATDVNALYTASVVDATISFLKGGGGTFPITINNVANAVSASHAITADTASFLPSDTNLNINSITASFASFSSASIGYLQSITGSAKIIGDAFIILNNNTPTERFAGIVVQDSGSTQNTASLEFDGQTNDWFYEYTDDGGATTDHGVAMFGPEYNTKGSPTYLTNNTIPKGDGGHHLNDSSITDDGTLVTINANVSASGYISASSFIGPNGEVVAGLVNGTGTDSIQSAASLTAAGAADASGAEAIAIGRNAVASTIDSVAIGTLADANGNKGIAIGEAANASTVAVAIGRLADASTYGGTAVGQQATATGNSSVAYGFQSTAENDSSLALGKGANATGSLAFDLRFNDASAITATTASQDITFVTNISASEVSASAFYGDGSNLTGISTDPFPYTGSAIFSGSIELTGSISVSEDVLFISASQTGSAINNVHPAEASSSAQINHIVSLTQGQYDTISGSGAASDDTFYIISDATDEVLPGNLEVSGQIYSPVYTSVTIVSSTASIDFNDGNFQELDASSGLFVANPTNVKSGTTYTLIITSGSGVSGYGSNFKFAGGTAPTFSGGTDILTMVSDGSNLYGTGLANFS